MAFKLSALALEKAIKHLCKYGDTDVFPHLPELAFFRDETAAIVTELKELDLDSYNPGGAFEALAPKSRFGFRITHQLSAVDTVLLLAAVIEIGSLIEARRPDAKGLEAFSYRFDSIADESLLLRNRTFKDWLHAQQNLIQGNLKFKQVVLTDISDFYARINFHRLENLLDEAAPASGAARYIKKVIKVIRAKQSFGLPVGGSAARLLAELALSDTDQALMDHGIIATRFVDDFRIFLSAGENPYDALSFLAQQLSITEGLSLNAAKTTVMSRTAYLETLKGLTSDISEEAEGKALEALTANIYFDETPDFEDVEALKALNLLGFLQEEIGKEDYDVGRIKVIFRALKIAKPSDAIDYIVTNFSELVVFAKEVSLLMQALEEEAPGCFNGLTDSVINAILEPPASSVQLIRTWLLELFVRGTVPIAAVQFKQIEGLSSLLDKRQLHIIRGRTNNKFFFRMNKAAFGQIPPFEQSAFVSGAVCLPKDEYENWLVTLKPIFSGPTCHLFLKWVKANKEKVIAKLGVSMDEHVE
ncbi:hypothetical protein CN221_14715 [Sinorhizobium meliloti]|uniref:reverse transcriptase domain-containing protein n=1 Tax=Rhizobium meliloti TaxID=382 RepID=UPI000FE03B1F|nr:reverse transcriptase domain-containing protein [Sinorhizobium meliloti]RVG94827.1 hypothetical protein CN221_14715 [Sinorhizobium meliloti]RVH65455.1 hypothetical protein CN209_12660 [Sinorhizobium meliloti]